MKNLELVEFSNSILPGQTPISTLYLQFCQRELITIHSRLTCYKIKWISWSASNSACSGPSSVTRSQGGQVCFCLQNLEWETKCDMHFSPVFLFIPCIYLTHRLTSLPSGTRQFALYSEESVLFVRLFFRLPIKVSILIERKEGRRKKRREREKELLGLCSPRFIPHTFFCLTPGETATQDLQDQFMEHRFRAVICSGSQLASSRSSSHLVSYPTDSFTHGFTASSWDTSASQG